MPHGRASRLTMIYLVLAVCLALGLGAWAQALAPHAAAHAGTSGGGPCEPVTAQDLHQPQVAPVGHASAYLDRAEGTAGTLLTLAGSGWPANAHISMDAWFHSNGQLWYGGSDLVAAKTTASGALPPTQFRLLDVCSAIAQHVPQPGSATILLAVHTAEANVQTVRARQPVVFTYLSPPTVAVRSKTLSDPYEEANAHVGDVVPFRLSGWTPGTHISISAVNVPWRTPPPWASRPEPLSPSGATSVTTIIADRTGGVAFSVTLPDAPPTSSVSFWLHANDARFGDIGFIGSPAYFILPKILPSILVANDTTTPGGALYIAGDNWLPNQQVVIEYCRGQTNDAQDTLYCDFFAAQALVTLQSDNTGHFYAEVSLPSNARLGPITVQARIAAARISAPLVDAQQSVFAQAEPVTIVPPVIHLTYAQLHPRREWLIEHAWYFGGGALLVLLGAALGALATWRVMRRRSGAVPARQG